MRAQSRPGGRHQRVVIISPVLPHEGIRHAGGLYLLRLYEALVAAGVEPTFLVPLSEESALTMPGAPIDVIFLKIPLSTGLFSRVIARAVWEAQKKLRNWNPNWPQLSFIGHLVTSRAARESVREADVVDLQWPETAQLTRWVRRLNGQAHIVATFHDVLSQKWERQLLRPGMKEETARRGLESARRLERATLLSADRIIVFSDKDRDLLIQVDRSSMSTIEVVQPPLGVASQQTRDPSLRAPRVVFVGSLIRWENEDAALWLIRDIWPLVLRQVPEATLEIAGAGGSDILRTAVGNSRNTTLPGFVPDLSAYYATASVCVVPLRFGAGVKFKTVEALIAGVPTVTTQIGAEGIAGPEGFAGFTDDPVDFARAIVESIRAPLAAEQRASRVQKWAQARYDVELFSFEVRRIYCLNK